MGEVYRATDTKLGREVALKVLPAEMARDPERLARFQREARAVAALNHPHIVTIFSVEEADGVHFLTMELVEGQSLDRHIPEHGLPLAQLAEMAIALSEALSAAHEKGIVHRDLKPANVMVTDDGRIKVLDFGLAKELRATSSTDATLTSGGHTEAGVVMGTPAYMSPEQVAGRPLDHRTDIFSLGIILYEMASGRRPFEGRSPAELASSILRDTPPVITESRTDLPSDMARVIRRCLEKDPRHRVQTARDVSNEFRDLARQTSHVPPAAALLDPARPSAHSSTHASMASGSGEARAGDGFWVAVLPFKYSGTNAELAALAEGLTEDIVTGLSRFSYLRVIARSSTARLQGEAVDVRSAGKELGARYVIEGSLRQAGAKLRVAVQLVDTTSGAHLWAETYERTFRSEAVFELQDDLVPRIVSTMADMNGVLPRSMGEALRSRTPQQLTPYEAVLRSFGYFERVAPDELAAARTGLELAVKKSPAYADAWAMLALLCVQDYAQGFNLQADSLTIGAAAARRATEAAPSNHLACFSLAQALFFQKEFQSFQNAAERAVSLNPMDGNSMALLGEMRAYAGDWERGLALSQRARQLNPHHPGWYWHVDFNNAYRQRDYRGALNFALQMMNVTSNWGAHALSAAVYGQLGEHDAAGKALREVLKMRPDFAATISGVIDKWFDPEHGKHLMDGLRKAGLRIPAPGEAPRGFSASKTSAARDISPSVSKDDSGRSKIAEAAEPGATDARSPGGGTRAEEELSVAVLPFESAGGGSELEALADGLTQDITTGLSRFSYLHVISRTATMPLGDQAADMRPPGKDRGARYRLEGGVRKSGSNVRISARVVDTATGEHVWAENYDRELKATSLFELQDDVTAKIVSTVGDSSGALPRAMAAVVRRKPSEHATPYEAVLRQFGLWQHVSPEEHAIVRTCLERAVEQAPDYADAWASLALVYLVEHSHSFNPRPDPLGRASAATAKALALNPASQIAYYCLAETRFFQKDFEGSRQAAERAVALNPLDGNTKAMMGNLAAYSGDWDRGLALTEDALQLNPHHPGWYHYVKFWAHYRKHEYQEALAIARMINMPGYFYHHSTLACVLGQLGRSAEAQRSVRELLKMYPDFPTQARAELGKWMQPDLVEHFIEGMRKAGMEVPASEGATTHSSQAPLAASSAPSSGEMRSARTDSESGRSRLVQLGVAVLPFTHTGADADLESFADGLAEDINAGLARFPYLSVISRNSTLRYKGQSADARTVGEQLGARYVLEGGIRKGTSTIRINIQLIDTQTGAHLWAETYNRNLKDSDIFALQDDLTDRVVATVADTNGVLLRSMAASVEASAHERPEAELTSADWLLRYCSYRMHMTPDEHARLRDGLERAVEREPRRAIIWACLSQLYIDEFRFGFNSRPSAQDGALDRALAASRRSVELDRTCQQGHQALAEVHFFRRDTQAFRTAAEQAMTLNPRNTDVLADMGLMLVHIGDFEHGAKITRRAMDINPHHAGWYHFSLIWESCHNGDYEKALEHATRVNMPGLFWQPLVVASLCGLLGRRTEAAAAVNELRKLDENIEVNARHFIECWHYSSGLMDRIVEGLRKAGIALAPEKGAAGPAPASATPDRGTTISGIGARPAIAVLPFQNLSGDPEQEYFADGITEEISNALAQIAGLRVAGRSSAFSFKGRNEDLRSVGSKLGVNTILEGTLRRSGNRLRITAQLIDAVSGYQLWSERYDRVMEDIFAVQDEIARTIAERLRLSLSDDGPAQPMQPPTRNMGAYELYLKGRGLLYQRGLSIAKAIDCFNQAVALDPAYAQAWAGLADGHTTSAYSGFKPASEAMPRALEAARRALQLDSHLAEAHNALACATLLYELNFDLAEKEFRRALQLNPNYPQARAWYGLFFLQWIAGREQEGRDELLHLLQIDPLSAYANVILSFSGICSGRISEAVDHGRRGVDLDPHSYLAYWSLMNALLCSARYEDAAATAERALAISGRHSWALATLVSIYAAWGKPDNARAIYREIEARSAREYVQPSMLALAAASLEEMDQAISFAEQALREKDPLFVTLVRSWPVYAPLRTDPRFLKVVAQLNLPGWNRTPGTTKTPGSL